MATRAYPVKTERLTVLVSPEEKATLHARAEALGLSTGEMIRRAALAYRPPEETAESEVVLEALADELVSAAREAREALKSAEKELRSTLRGLARNRGV